MGGVHYQTGVKLYQVILVLSVLFLITYLINDFVFIPTIKAYGLLIVVITTMALLSLGVLYLISSMAGVTGLKEGTKVTAEREKEY